MRKRANPGGAYAHSKLANILFTYELQRRFESAGVEATASATHPGWTATDLPAGWTASTRRLDWRLIQMPNPLIGQLPEMGALPTLYAATAPDVQGGDYYGPGGWGGLTGCPVKVRSSDRSYDAVVAAKLWTASEELTGVRYQWPVGKAASKVQGDRHLQRAHPKEAISGEDCEALTVGRKVPVT